MKAFVELNKLKPGYFDFTARSSQMLLVEVIRVGFYSAMLVITSFLTIQQPHFINYEFISPVYGLLACAFMVHFFYVWFFNYTLRLWYAKAAIFVFDTLLLTAVIYHSGLSQSIFLFLFLVNIVLCGFVFQTRGAIMLALWTSILFSVLLLVGTEDIGQKVIFTLGVNNLAFFVVAVLSGLLSDQINFMGAELKEKARDIQVLQDFNKLIVENITTGIITIDAYGKIIHYNPAAVNISKHAGEMQNKSVTELFPHFIDYFGKSDPNGKLKEEAIPQRRILHMRNQDESKRVLELITSPMRENSGQLSGFILLFQDLTEIYRLESEVRQVEKMAAVGQLAAGIAHEIRNPLASISGSVELLFSLLKSQTEDENKLMSIVMKEIGRLNGLISEFLDFVKPEGAVETPIQINEVIQSVIDLTKMNANLNHKIKLAVDSKSQRSILGNFNKLKQAVLNIVINAYQAMEKKESGSITVKTFDLEDRVVLKIKDEGMGISEGNIKRIFEPFHTTKKSGTGLGLAVTHKILEVHRAKVYVDSVLDKGTEFTIEFPSNQQVVGSSIDMLTKTSDSKESIRRGVK